jgi:hypothetical protein
MEETLEIINERRVKVGTGVVRVDRIRKGKTQRKKLKSTRKGYKMVGRRSVRQNPTERRKRRIGTRRATRKRAAKMNRILLKRKISIKRGKRQGLYR